jgi:MarR family transcriptional regulator, lower aerobic nicotinate degradation pathway regulator
VKPPPLETYRLEDQIGFLIRKASQRHAAIFAQRMIEQLTPTQWAVLVKLAEAKPVSQNQLGRETAMDVATIKGVVDRLIKRGFVTTSADPDDSRRSLIAITSKGRDAVIAGLPVAFAITEETLKTLDADEREMLQSLLRKLT